MCIDLKDIRKLTFMVCSFCFAVVFFPMELSTLLFCMTKDDSPCRSSSLLASRCKLMTRASRALWDCRSLDILCAVELRKFCICNNYDSMGIGPRGFTWIASAWVDVIESLLRVVSYHVFYQMSIYLHEKSEFNFKLSYLGFKRHFEAKLTFFHQRDIFSIKHSYSFSY